MYLFSNQMKVAVNHISARCCCCRVWYEYEMILKYMLCKASNTVCPSSSVTYPSHRSHVYHGNLSARGLEVFGVWRHSVFPRRDSQCWDVHRYIQPTRLRLDPCLYYSTTRELWFHFRRWCTFLTLPRSHPRVPLEKCVIQPLQKKLHFIPLCLLWTSALDYGAIWFSVRSDLFSPGKL